MITFWCSWCGEVAQAESEDAHVPCFRCAREFARLFGFWPQTGMTPLSPGEEPGEPAAARKRFALYDAETGALRGKTWSPEDDASARAG